MSSPSIKVHAIRVLRNGREITRCSWKVAEWVTTDDPTKVTCPHCQAQLEFERQLLKRKASAEAEQKRLADQRRFQQFLNRQRVFAKQGDNE